MKPNEDPMSRYLQNLDRMRELRSMVFPADESGERILSRLADARAEAAAIRKEDEILLRDPALGLSVPPAGMSAQQAETLRRFAGQLARFASQKDLGLFYQVHQHLLAYAEAHGDRDLEIEEHYYCGIALYYLRTTYESLHMDTYEDEMLAHFSANAQMLPQIASVANHDSQFFILRSCGNLKLAYTLSTHGEPFALFQPRPGDLACYIACQHDDFRLFFDQRLEAEMPYIPWASVRYAVCSGAITLLSYLRDTNDPQEASFVYEQSRYVEQHMEQQENTKDRFVKPRTAYFLSAARFHAGLITIDQLLENLFRILEKADPKDYSLDGTYLNLDLGCFVLAYWGAYSREEKWRPQLDAIRMHAGSYLRSMPNSDCSHLVAMYLIHQMNMNYLFHFQSDAGYLLRSLMILDRPTYVHSSLVSELALAIGTWLHDHHPEIFDDLAGCLAESGQPASSPFLLEMIRMSGLYSDVGILSILPVAEMQARPLTKEETGIYQLHPYAGYVTLCLHPDTAIYAAAALGHHRWYDGTAGYPEYYDRAAHKDALAADITAAADFLESSTNPLGDCAGMPLSFSEAAAMICEGAGTRFHPLMAEAMADQELRSRLSVILERGRRAAVIRIYRAQEAQED